MSHNTELRERDKKFRELQQEVRVLMENIKSDIIPLLSSYDYLIKKKWRSISMLITQNDASLFKVQDIWHITISYPLVILSFYDGTLAFTSLSTKPTSAGSDNCQFSASQSTLPLKSGLRFILLRMLSSSWPMGSGSSPIRWNES